MVQFIFDKDGVIAAAHLNPACRGTLSGAGSNRRNAS